MTPSLLLLFSSAPLAPTLHHLTSSLLISPFIFLLFPPLLNPQVFISSHSSLILFHPLSTNPFPRCLLFSPPLRPLCSSVSPSCRLSIHQYFSSRQIASLLYCCAELTVCLSSPWALNTLNQRLKEIDILPLR